MLDVRVGGKRVLWGARPLEVLDSFRQRKPRDDEAGGILLGEVAGDVVLISRLTGPTRRDRRSRFGFVRSRVAAQAVVDYEHLFSGGTVTYLGEWHTHPAAAAVPSRCDERMIRSQWRRNTVPANFLLLAILGIDSDYLGVVEDGVLHGTGVHLTPPERQ